MKSCNLFDNEFVRLIFAAPDSCLRAFRGDLAADDVDAQINREAETC